MASSGSFTGARGGNSTGPYLKLDWSTIETDIANNKSKVRLVLKVVSDYNISFSATKYGNLEGTSFSYSSGMSGAGTITVKTKDMWIAHNSDGTKSHTFDGDFDIRIYWSGIWVETLTVSGTATLDTIPRESDFTAFTLTNTVLNTSTANTINYTLDRKSTDFTQDMTLMFGNKVIASWNTSGTGSLTRTLTSSEVNTIITSMPNSTSGTLTLTMQTKSGTTNVGSSKSINEGFSLDVAIKPSASSLTASIYGSGRDSVIGKYVQSISKVTSSFTRSAGYGASISTSTITVKRSSDGGNSQTISGSSGTTANPVNLSGTYTVEGYVKDSRGRTSKISISITVDAYSPPSVSKFVTDRTTTTTTVSADIVASWSALGTSNPTDITVVGVDNAGLSTTHYTLNDSTAGSFSTTQNYTGQSDASSYTYTITVTDSFGKQAKAISTVSTSFVELTIAKGIGIGVGKVRENGALDVEGDVYISGNVLNAKNLVNGDNDTASSRITDFNDLWRSGFYDGYGVANAPGGDTGWWWTINVAHRSNSPTYKYNGQIAFQNNSSGAPEAYIRTTGNDISTTSWGRLWHSSNFDPASKLDTSGGTLTGTLHVNVIAPRGNDAMGIFAGESDTYSSNISGEWVWLVGEAGVKMVASPDNWSSGWSGRDEINLTPLDGTLKLWNSNGFVRIGPNNTSYSHFYTDRPTFYFSTGLAVDTGNIRAHNERLSLNGGDSLNQVEISGSNLVVQNQGSYSVYIDDCGGDYSEVGVRPSSDNRGNLGSGNYTWNLVYTSNLYGTSHREKKNNIHRYDETLAYEQLRDIPLYTFSYNSDTYDDKHIGSMIEYLPSEIVDVTSDKLGEAKGVSYNNAIFFNLAVSKELQKRVEELETRLLELEGTA